MIIFSTPCEDLSGYAQAGRDYVRAFYEAGVDIKTHFRSFDHRGSNEKLIDPAEVKLCKKLQINNFPNERDFTWLCHATPNASFTVPARKNVLYSVWETDHIPLYFKQFIDEFDFILTASEFSKNAFLTTCPKLNIKVLPHIIHDFSPSKFPVDINFQKKLKDKFVFLWNGEWIRGKGYDVLLKAFNIAFQGNKDVILLLKTYNLGILNYKDEVINSINRAKKEQFPQILPLIGDLPRDYTLGLYQLANMFINTSKREGFSLTSSEALGFGLPVIAPDKGGHREFLNNNNSLLYKSYWDKVTNLEVERSLYAGQQWVESDIDMLVDMLKYSYENYDSVKKELTPGIKSTIKEFSAKNITTKFVGYMK